MIRLSTIIALLFIGGGTLFLTSLGFWQLQRLQQKEAMIGRVKSNIDGMPQSVAEIEALRSAGDDIEYRPANATGTFDHTGETYFYVTNKGRAGYHVYTPLKQASGSTLLVNRGFVPLEMKDPATRPQGQITGPVTITGLARSAPAEKPNSLVPDNDLAGNIFYWKSLSQMLSLAGDKTEMRSERFFLDADDTPVPGGFPRGGITRISFPNNHLQYAYTWFGLAGALIVVGGAFLFSRRKPATAGKA